MNKFIDLHEKMENPLCRSVIDTGLLPQDGSPEESWLTLSCKAEQAPPYSASLRPEEASRQVQPTTPDDLNDIQLTERSADVRSGAPEFLQKCIKTTQAYSIPPGIALRSSMQSEEQ